MVCTISGKSKGTLIELLEALVEDDPSWEPILEELQTCEAAVAHKAAAAPADGPVSKKTGRPLTKYQLHMGSCMRPEAKGGRGQPMKECVDEWNAAKAKA